MLSGNGASSRGNGFWYRTLSRYTKSICRPLWPACFNGKCDEISKDRDRSHASGYVVAVTASAMASLQEESQGRAICGIGRGDSSAAHIGKRQATTEEQKLRCDIKKLPERWSYRSRQYAISNSLVDPKVISPVPIDIACTGPRTIKMACDVADRVSFAVGSAFERVEWAMNTAKEHLEKAEDQATAFR